jgi:poly-gamma-glutamate capsule biosynthesis protein CapA/YwtB (metallophosphatase superfamily)
VSRAPESATLRLRAVGDIMLGSAFPDGSLPPDDGTASFGAVASLLKDADLTLGNLEGPLCDTEAMSTKCKPDAAPGSCYAFRTPTRYAPLFPAAGFDVLTVANNHANDFGPACRDQTATAFAPLGVALTGRPGVKARRTVNGLEVTVLGFHTGDTGYNLNDAEIAAAVVASAAAESDLVVVTFHGGAEGGGATRVPAGREFFRGEDRGDLRAFARAAIDAGADVVIGHGPHVLRGMEVYKDRLIAYSLGNFATYGRFNLQGDQGVGAVLEVKLARDGRWLGGKVFPTVQQGRGTVAPDPAGRALTLLRTLSPTDFGPAAVIPDDTGALARACDGAPCR